MATPTVTSITPATGPVGGLSTITIIGGNFIIPPTPPPGPSPPFVPTMEVWFGLEKATFVDVYSTTTMVVGVPPYQGLAPDGPLPATDITIKNLDSLGVPILGETLVVTGAYTYLRPVIHGSGARANAIDHPFTNTTEELALLLRRQVIQNVSITTHVDFAEPGVLTINIAKVPAIIIQGPGIGRDFEYWDNELRIVENVDTTVSIRKPPFIARLTYTLVGVSDNEREILNLMGSVNECFDRVKFLLVQKNPHNVNEGKVKLVLQLTQPPQVTSTPSENNIRTFLATCEVRGVAVLETEQVRIEREVDDTELTAQQFTDGLPETIIIT